MRTLLLKPDEAGIKKAAAILRRGGLVAFPTETVYGLGADAFHARACRKIFKAKHRPSDNPLIVHVARQSELGRLVAEIPSSARKLMKKFWPGPLTLVLRKTARVPSVVSGGLQTVAVRMPDHPVALQLIRAAGCPIAAPSANVAGKPSPTDAQHVVEDLRGRIEAVLDGGPTEHGVESTIVDLSRPVPELLRPGAVTLEQLRKAIGRVRVHASVKRHGAVRGKALSPGMKYRHYAPKAEVVVIRPPLSSRKLGKALKGAKGRRTAVLTTRSRVKADAIVIVFPSVKAFARRLFAYFRLLDKAGIGRIVVEGVPEKGIGLTLMNRALKAAKKVV
ncbi:MAG TPA: threonylcarbamoyl-AMP synthase [Candidatus Diapherotrites archaeon]|uniref:Threonylcarbamoyl-AMP synthase n=1 Tax=Candidatus Iainarchaeum sp. TaxID=3101447 RepID=A0A7J4JIS5_9ARCH|nr:threonylcarbamoyl-AMP synthase [Candidatus Diapherotrites archaeon]HIH15837.1 threonylcarbamoyl-AMP synthase [Candidatus Diapherotrites archaeon]